MLPQLFLLLTSGVPGRSAPAPITVQTTLGAVLGVEEVVGGSSVATFRGVPFAAPTGGANRFMPPQPRAPWSGLLDATLDGPGCRQPHHNADVPCEGKEGPRCQSEDCLSVNVYCPSGADADKPQAGYPVMFWIYGGAFDEGTNHGALGLYEGKRMAAAGRVCVVAPQYRLGVLGFLVTPANPGNQGLQDQRAAVRWVQANVAAFGGDPGAVTIWGESAGAMSVAAHLASERSAGLFRAAIMQSNVAAFQYQNHLVQRSTYGKDFVNRTGCGSLANLACLQAIDAKAITTLGEDVTHSVKDGVIARLLEGGRVEDALAMQWAPVIDGVELKGQPLDILAAGGGNQVPVLLGSNQDEGATFVFAGVSTKLPMALYKPLMTAIFGKNASAAVVDFYDAASAAWTDARDALSYVLTDFWFKCSAHRIAKAAAAGGWPAWVYRYNHEDSFKKLWPIYGLPTQCEDRVCHGAEIPFVFDNYANFSATADELAMSADMLEYWSSFAKTGDPNAGGKAALAWPAFNGTDRLNIRLSIPTAVESSKDLPSGVLPTPGVCDFFDDVVGYHH